MNPFLTASNLCALRTEEISLKRPFQLGNDLIKTARTQKRLYEAQVDADGEVPTVTKRVGRVESSSVVYSTRYLLQDWRYAADIADILALLPCRLKIPFYSPGCSQTGNSSRVLFGE